VTDPGPWLARSAERYPALRPFLSRNFRIYYTGQFIAVLGSWLQNIAMSWLVYRLSGSALALGVTAFAQQIPTLLLAPLVGVLADRTNRRRLLIIVQSLGLLQAVAITLLTLTGHVSVWHVIVLSLWTGMVNAFETPTRQAFLLELLLERRHLPNAIALQSFLMNTTRLLGPSLAGVLLAWAGEDACFAINAVCYLAIVAAYRFISPPPRTLPPAGESWRRALEDGFRYAFGDPVNRRLIAFLGGCGFLSSPWQSLMPVIAKEVMGGDSKTLGVLIGAVGGGAIFATVYLASRRTVRGIERIMVATAFVAACAFLAFSFMTQLAPAALLLAVFGFGLIATVSAGNSILQTIADDHYRGRIVSVYVMTFLGSMPLGNLLGGICADALGAPWTLHLFASGLLALALWFVAGFRPWRAQLRERFNARGIARPRELSASAERT
jgi:MFS family permease